MKKVKRPLKECTECGSTYFVDMSEMKELCPECSHYLYGYDKCNHKFKNDRCINCHWDGTHSEYINSLKNSK